MKGRIITITISLISFIGLSQNKQYYQPSQKYYIFNLSESCELHFDSTVYDNGRPIILLLKNDTPDTVTVTYKSLISSKIVFKELSTRYILPGEYYSISPIFNQNRYSNSSFLNAGFWFKYSSPETGQEHQRKISFYGNIFLDTLSEFVMESKLDFQIAQTPVPIVQNKYKGGTTEKDAFVFNEKLEFILINKDSKPIYNELKLNYQINHGEIKTIYSDDRESFFIKCEKGDTIQYSILCSEYGMIDKGRLIRTEKTNQYKAYLNPKFPLTIPHYYSRNERVPIDSNMIGSFHISAQELKNAEINIEDVRKYVSSFDGTVGTHPSRSVSIYYILKINPEHINTVRKKFSGIKFQQMLSQYSYLGDTYILYFTPSLKWTEQEVLTFLEKKNLTVLNEKIWKRSGKYSKYYSYYAEVELIDSNNKSQITLINELMSLFEIEFIDSSTAAYEKLD